MAVSLISAPAMRPRSTAYDTKLPSGVDLGDVLNSVDPCFLYITREIVD